ncbi:MAG: PH domain-containing protein [Chloroflexi bacterium]|nr:PH domain-containing protein [Chloroflexota bacterium]
MASTPKRGLGARLYDNTWLALLRRLLVSAIIAGPFLLGGIYGLTIGDFPQWASIVVLGVGALLMFVGLYMSFTGIVPSPSLLPGETQLEMRHPTMKPAYARMVFSLPFLLGALYVGFRSELPYVYPTVLFVVGLFFFFKGAMRYMRNLHITYTVTDRRVVHMYRFLWLNTKEIPVSRIISISEARSFFEIITGRGSVVVASGIGERQVIKIEDINDPGSVAESLRALLPP